MSPSSTPSAPSAPTAPSTPPTPSRRTGPTGRPAPPRQARALAWLLIAAASAVLSGCAGSLLPKPPEAPALHTLDGTSAPAGAPASAPAIAGAAPRQPAPGARVLVVAVPSAAAGFDSDHMVYLRRPQQLETFAFHAWVATPAQMLAPLIVRALQDGGAFRAVLLAPSSGAGAWRLETELVRLQQDFIERPSRVRLTLRAVLIDTTTRQVLAWREFDASVPAASDDPAGGVAAAGQATQRVLGELAAFCAEQALAR